MATSNLQIEAIEDCAHRLQARWEAVAEHWSDGVQREFAQHHYAPLQQEHGHMAAKANALTVVLQTAQRNLR